MSTYILTSFLLSAFVHAVCIFMRHFRSLSDTCGTPLRECVMSA